MAEKYDVFISFKNTDPKGGLTVDRTIAQRLHDKLLDEGLNVFFSEKDLSDTEFMSQIYTALDEADLLIVVSTNQAYVRSKWVKSEWMNFLGAINSGRKPNGKIMTILSHITTHDLPLELSNFQSFDANSLDDAVAYVFRTLGRISNSQARQWKKAENELKLKKAEEERLKAIKAQMAAEEHKKHLNAHENENKAVGNNQKSILIAVAAVVLVALISLIAGAGSLGLFGADSDWKNSISDDETALIIEYTGNESDWKYSVLDDGTVAITDYTGNESEIILPSKLQGKTVTQINTEAFHENSNLTSVTIPNSVTSIGDSAFAFCGSLTTITIPDSVTSIGSGAFWECSSLATITIPDSVTSIGIAAFDGCSGLSSVTISASVTSISDQMFHRCSSLTTITIPDSVTSIGKVAFWECNSLTKVTIPDSVITIGEQAFQECNSLTSVTLGKNVHVIDEAAFHECSRLTSVTIPDSVTFIGRWAFRECNNLISLTIGESVNNIGDCAFYGCNNLTTVTIPDRVNTIGDWAFDGCINLTVYAPHPASDYNSKTLGNYKKWVVQ